MQRLNRVHECWSILFAQNIGPDLNYVVGSNTKEVLIECGMMQLAESQPVRNDRFSSRLGVGNDVRGVKKFVVPESTERTLVPIGIENPFPKGSLVQSLPHGCCYVLTPARFLLVVYR